MTPEAEHLLARAEKSLDEGRQIATLLLAEVTARCAYLAAFHAAEAYLFEKNGRVGKTHHGVRTEFSRLAMNDPKIPPDMPAFLRQAYRFKEVSDYGTATDEAVTMETATEAMASAEEFIVLVRAALEP